MEERHFKKSPKSGQVLPDERKMENMDADYHLDQDISEDRNINTEIRTDTSDGLNNSEEDQNSNKGTKS